MLLVVLYLSANLGDQLIVGIIQYIIKDTDVIIIKITGGIAEGNSIYYKYIVGIIVKVTGGRLSFVFGGYLWNY